ncbi:hypothetical protein BKA82DRAFT_4015804 [Pisolithus tinctorius]|nr:hypothetical protein BKA82DRAFT_4015804 [Pisolithus tinctorius]
MFSGILYGCALVQTYVYITLFPNDSWKFKTLLKLLVYHLFHWFKVAFEMLYTFSHKKALPTFCSFLVIAQFAITLVFGFFIGATESTFIGTTDSTFTKKFITPTLFITICVDTTIAVSMSYYLKANELGFHRTSHVVDQMVCYIMGAHYQDNLDMLSLPNLVQLRSNEHNNQLYSAQQMAPDGININMLT